MMMTCVFFLFQEPLIKSDRVSREEKFVSFLIENRVIVILLREFMVKNWRILTFGKRIMT